MKPAAGRLILVTLLFVAWLGYLVFLVATRPKKDDGTPLVVSRPQVLTSEVDVIAEINDPHGDATVAEVLWPENAPLKEGEKIKIEGVADSRQPGRGAPADWSGAGFYLVPLRRGPGGWEVAPIPSSPGFDERVQRIYPATPEALAQYRAAPKPAE
jgi:hypothetical protein